MNNSSASFAASASNGALPSGSTANVRWEITSTDTGSGLFNMVIRRGDDYENSKTILETWNGLSLDPNQGNYIAYVIGDQAYTVATDDLGNNYLQLTGSYANKSKYVRVKSVSLATPSYFNSYGQPLSQYTASLPNSGSGSFNGSFGTATGAIWGSFGVEKVNFFENIPNIASSNIIANSNIQGVHPEDYTIALNLLGNKDAYDFNVLYTPGLTNANAPSAVNSVVNVAQNRGDNIAVIDMVGYGQQINAVVGAAQAYDNSYAATYWPWLQIRSRETGKLNFVPASTIVPAAYEYNDKVSAEWWAPAGLNRGALPTVLQPERKLTSNDRDRLYQGSVNPIATFPGVGTVIYGQKTLQQKASALDRVNVRRLLISLKSYIGQIGETLVFEPNTQVTRNKFINQVNPYLESVQQRQGLYAFQVVMDETNNTPSVIDRNQLVGTIYLQPTRTAEFIQLDFNILPTGTTFGQ
jgi:phage tail sheath protein FI